MPIKPLSRIRAMCVEESPVVYDRCGKAPIRRLVVGRRRRREEGEPIVSNRSNLPGVEMAHASICKEGRPTPTPTPTTTTNSRRSCRSVLGQFVEFDVAAATNSLAQLGEKPRASGDESRTVRKRTVSRALQVTHYRRLNSQFPRPVTDPGLSITAP
jgi:hypothetical protein